MDDLIDPKFNFSQNKGNTIDKGNRMEMKLDYSYGFMDFNIPDVISKTSDSDELLKLSPIDLYNKPEGEVIDSIQFVLKHFSVSEDLYDGEFHFSGECYELITSKGTVLHPYRLKHGEKSAKQIATNKIIENSTSPWVRIHIKPDKLYQLSVRVYGDWENDWLCISLDDVSLHKVYIQRNDERMCFVSWEQMIEQHKALSFQGYDGYDHPSRYIKKGLNSEDKVGEIFCVFGDWIEVALYKEGLAQTVWVRWRDKNGLLPGIFPFSFIY